MRGVFLLLLQQALGVSIPSTSVFGHKVPDTDAICAAIAYAWELNERGTSARAYRLGSLNRETEYVLRTFEIEEPPLLGPLAEGAPVAIVDTNNPKELPDDLDCAALHSIVDHHKLCGLSTDGVLEVDIRPLCSTGSILYSRAKALGLTPPRHVAGLLLSCILSDSLEFRSPTTTPLDRELAQVPAWQPQHCTSSTRGPILLHATRGPILLHAFMSPHRPRACGASGDAFWRQELAELAGVDMHEHAVNMLNAKAEIEHLSPEEVVMMDSKTYEVGGRQLRVSVLETTAPHMALRQKDALRTAMKSLAAEQGLDDVLLFVVDVLKQQATFISASESASRIVEHAYSCRVGADGTVVLPDVLSRKKQIMPALEASARRAQPPEPEAEEGSRATSRARVPA